MTDLVERLRRLAPYMLSGEAADEIVRLRRAYDTAIDQATRADASFYNECLRTQELAEEVERLRAENDEADSLITELLGISQIGTVAYPEGSTRELAIKNWERRCIERSTAMIAEIVGPDGRVHYRRPPDDPLVDEARRTPGYSVRFVAN